MVPGSVERRHRHDEAGGPGTCHDGMTGRLRSRAGACEKLSRVPDTGASEELAAQVRRSRAAVADATAVLARATAAMAGAVTIVTSVATRHGHLLRSDRAATGAALGPMPASRIFTHAGVSAARRMVQNAACDFGLGEDVVTDFVLAVQELMTNAVRHGGGWGRISLHRAGDVLVCTVTDHGPGISGDPGRFGELPPAEAEGGRGLWLARQLTDSLELTTGPAGVKATVTIRRPPSPYPR